MGLAGPEATAVDGEKRGVEEDGVDGDCGDESLEVPLLKNLIMASRSCDVRGTDCVYQLGMMV